MSRRWKEPLRLALRAPLAIGALMAIYVFVLPQTLNALLNLESGFRQLVAFAITLPLGIMVGLPFPTGMRIVDQHVDNRQINWMWGLNGLYSLLGSTLSVAIAISYGFSAVLLMGGATYLMIFLAGKVYLRRWIS